MNENLQHIQHFFSTEISDNSSSFLRNYGLEDAEWFDYWEPLKNRIFRSDAAHLPDLLFNEKFHLMAMIGGVIFTKKEFEALKQCMIAAEEDYFVVIENEKVQPIILNNENSAILQPIMRFKFPVSIVWEELSSGGILSMELIDSSYREYFVFGNSAKWGKYIASEYWDRSVNSVGTPLDIIGYQPELEKIFKSQFKQTKADQKKVASWLPSNYEQLI